MRSQLMVGRVLRLCLLACGVLSLTVTVGSQTQSEQGVLSSLPVVPMNIRFRFVPQYFVQIIHGDPRYSRIEALVDNNPNGPWYEVILADKTTGNKIFYSNSEKTVNTLQHAGKIAFKSDIQFSDSSQAGSTCTYHMDLQESSGQQISWSFTVNGQPAEIPPGFLSRPNNSGLVLMKLERRIPAMPSTFLLIGNTRHAVINPPQSADARGHGSESGAFYGTGLTVAEILPGAELWSVDSWPEALKAGKKWTLHTSAGEKRALTIESVRDGQIVMDQVDQDGSSAIRLDLRRSGDDLALAALSAMSQSHYLNIAFTPALPFPTVGLTDTTRVRFVVSEDRQNEIAGGSILARRRFDDENLDWTFDAPDWARGQLMETGASVLIESAINGHRP